MVLLEIHPYGVRRFPFEGYAPRAVDVDCIDVFPIAFEAVEVKTLDIHVLRPCRGMQRIQAPNQRLDQLRVKLRGIVIFPEGFQSAAFEGLDHQNMCKPSDYIRQLTAYKL